jgi:hypothetical protein
LATLKLLNSASFSIARARRVKCQQWPGVNTT